MGVGRGMWGEGFLGVLRFPKFMGGRREKEEGRREKGDSKVGRGRVFLVS